MNEATLIIIPFNPKKLEDGVFVQRPNGKIYLPHKSEVNEFNRDAVETGEWHWRPVRLCLINDETPHPSDKQYVWSSVTNTVATFTDPRFFSEGTYKKVIAYGDEIKLIRCYSSDITSSESWEEAITDDDVNMILQRGGYCRYDRNFHGEIVIENTTWNPKEKK